MNVLLTGASGFVGGSLIIDLAHHARITGVYCRSRCDERTEATADSLVQADLQQPNEVCRLLSNCKPEVIIHGAALAQPAVCEADPAAAQRANVEPLKWIVSHYESSGRKPPLLISLSTDLVFDGSPPPPPGGFREGDAPQPRSVYGRSKLAAESLAAGYPGICCILRLCLVYGPRRNGRQGFLGWLLERLSRGEQAPLYCDEWRTPVCTADISACIAALLGRFQAGNASLPPLIHLAGSERLNRVQFGRHVCARFGFPSSLIAETKRGGNRSSDASCNAQLLARLLGRAPLDVRRGLEILPES